MPDHKARFHQLDAVVYLLPGRESFGSAQSKRLKLFEPLVPEALSLPWTKSRFLHTNLLNFSRLDHHL